MAADIVIFVNIMVLQIWYRSCIYDKGYYVQDAKSKIPKVHSFNLHESRRPPAWTSVGWTKNIYSQSVWPGDRVCARFSGILKLTQARGLATVGYIFGLSPADLKQTDFLTDTTWRSAIGTSLKTSLVFESQTNVGIFLQKAILKYVFNFALKEPQSQILWKAAFLHNAKYLYGKLPQKFPLFRNAKIFCPVGNFREG